MEAEYSGFELSTLIQHIGILGGGLTLCAMTPAPKFTAKYPKNSRPYKYFMNILVLLATVKPSQTLVGSELLKNTLYPTSVIDKGMWK